MRKGVSAFVSMVFYVAIVVAAVGMVLNIAMPRLESMQDSAAIENNVNFLTELDAAITDVASEGRYSSRTMQLSFDRGQYRLDNGTFLYEIETDSGIISTQATRQLGPVTLSANADVSVRETTINGQDCYLMENDRLEVCIKTAEDQFIAGDHPDTIGYWRMNEGTGQWANDSALYGNDGVLGGSTTGESGDPNWTDGIHDDGLRFDGDDDYVEVADSAALNPTDALTVSAWVRPHGNNSGDTYQAYVGKEYAKQWALAKAQTVNEFRWHINTTGSDSFDFVNVGSFENNNWYHLAMTYNASTGDWVKYINGEEVHSETLSGTIKTSSEPLMIGDDPRDSGTKANATIDEVRIYNRSLSAGEVEQLYTVQGENREIDTQDLLIHLYNKDQDQLWNGTLYTQINGREATRTGYGQVTPEGLGDKLGRGQITAEVITAENGTYTTTYSLFSGADFVTVQTQGDKLETTTAGGRFVIDDQNDPVYIDGRQRSPGVYTDNDLSFGYGIGTGSTMMSGVVSGGGFTQVGYDNETAGGRYEINVTNDDDGVFLVPFTIGSVNTVENRRNLIQGGVFGRNRFFSYPAPNFGYTLTEQKEVRAALSYDNILLSGPSNTISQGSYTLLVRNNGVANGKTNVSVSVK